MGDDTWNKVYPRGFNESYPYPSFNVKDLHTVDNGVIEHLLLSVRDAMARQAAARAAPAATMSAGSIVIGHYLGVDHVGHRFGPSHPVRSPPLPKDIYPTEPGILKNS